MKTKQIDPLHMLLPKELFAYSEVVDSQVGERDIHLFLDEKSIPPREGHYNFDNRSTNAAAESFNAKIKAFRIQFRSVRDIPFFIFRLSKLFA